MEELPRSRSSMILGSQLEPNPMRREYTLELTPLSLLSLCWLYPL